MTLFNQRLGALVKKEFRQLRRDPRATFSVILAPIIQLAIFGAVFAAIVSTLPLGVVDESRTPESRELIATLTESKSFQLAGYFDSSDALGKAIDRGQIDAGIVIPYDLARSLARERPATVQFLLNATNANTAAIAEGYAEGVVQAYDAELVRTPVPAGAVTLWPAFLFNPGLVSTWFSVTGVLGMLLILNGSLLAATTMIKERAAGTLDQLLMSPVTPTEIVIAKITPLFALLGVMAVFAMAIVRFVFGVPFHGDLTLVIVGEVLCLLCGIGVGTAIATFATTSRQVQLTIFFLNPPLAALSGAFSPVEAMPAWLQPLTLFNPIRHFGDIARGALIKGSGLDVLWPNFLALLAFTFVLVGLSIWRYRRQLG